HMVLQQEMALPIWGTAEPGEKVTVTVGSETANVTADAQGKWKVKLSPLAGATQPTTMTIAGKNTLTFADVLIGEVWFCSGQSNMGFNLARTDQAATDLPNANDAQMRYFHVMGGPDLRPSTSFACGKWELCAPEVAGRLSAVAYFFGKELRGRLN